MSSFKCLKVTITIDNIYKIPKNINLQDETQVKKWFIDDNYSLCIHLTNGRELEIRRSNMFDLGDPKTDKTSIVDAKEVGFERSEFGIAPEADEDGFIADYLCEHGCENCQKYFDDGRDNCRTCGLDLNFANEDEEEPEPEQVS